MAQSPQAESKRKLTPELAPETIGFRLSTDDRKLLQAHAIQAGVSAHVLARAFVEQVLRSGGSITALLALHDEISTLRGELSKLRRDIAVSTAVLLVSAGRSSTEAAKSWVENNLSLE